LAKVRVVIGVKGDRLHLRATFPPKPNSDKPQPYQQRLALGYHANPTGISLAETEARKVGALIDCHQFSWEPYLIQNLIADSGAIADWVVKFEQHYFDRRARNPKSMTT